MGDETRSQALSNAITDENANRGMRKAKALAGASVGVQRKALGEVKNWQTQSQDDATIETTSTQEVRSQNNENRSGPSKRKREIYRSDDEEEEEEEEEEQDASADSDPEGTAHSTKRPRLAAGSTRSGLLTWTDLDKDEKDDVCMVFEYTDDIFGHLYQREKQTTPTYNYLTETDSPQYLRPSLRAILIDWLVEVHQKFQLLPETLYLAINVMDRFMSQRKVSMAKLQLLAVCSLLIAAKFEEVNLPKLSQYAYITDGACTCQDIKDAEMYVLTTLKFNIGWPNPLNFLRRISKADDYDANARGIAKFFMEYAMCCPKFVDLIPSRVSAMAMFCARLSLDKSIKWDATLEHYSGGIDPLTDLEFQESCRNLVKEISKPSTQLKALEIKYRSKQMGSVFEPAKIWCDLMVAGDFEGLF